MRFLIDTNLPKALAAWLRSHGHEAEHVLQVLLAQSPDDVIWSQAQLAGAIIVSKDEDFADLSRRSTSGPAVVWLRTGNGTNAALLAYLAPLWPALEARLMAGDKLIELR